MIGHRRYLDSMDLKKYFMFVLLSFISFISLLVCFISFKINISIAFAFCGSLVIIFTEFCIKNNIFDRDNSNECD